MHLQLTNTNGEQSASQSQKVQIKTPKHCFGLLISKDKNRDGESKAVGATAEGGPGGLAALWL